MKHRYYSSTFGINAKYAKNNKLYIVASLRVGRKNYEKKKRFQLSDGSLIYLHLLAYKNSENKPSKPFNVINLKLLDKF